jgi:hypothetical protein
VDIIGRSELPVDRVVLETTYLSGLGLARLIERLRATGSAEQFLFREVEMDCLYREADAILARAEHDSAAQPIIERVRRIRGLCFQAHDLVGAEDTGSAVERLLVVTQLLEHPAADPSN